MRNYFIILLHIIIIILGVYFFNQQRSIYQQNLKASQDTISILKMANGNLLYERDYYILKESELTAVLNNSKNEITELRNKLDNIENITQIQTEVKLDTIYIPLDTNFNFKLEDPWFNVSGSVEADHVVINGISFPLNINTGFTDNEVFVEIDNPYVVLNNMNGVKVKNKRFKSGWFVGAGLQYGMFNGLDIGLTVGYGISF